MQVYLDNLYALYLTSIEWSVSSLFKTVTGARDWGPGGCNSVPVLRNIITQLRQRTIKKNNGHVPTNYMDEPNGHHKNNKNSPI